MINKVTNTQCRSKFLFFLLTRYKSLNNFLSGTSNAIFSLQIFRFNGFRRRGWKRTFGARPIGKMNTKFCRFVRRCRIFPQRGEMPILWLKPPFNEFRTRVNEQEFTLVWQDSRWVLWLVRFCSLWWVTQGNLPIPDFVCDKSYPLKVSKWGILNPS